MLTNSDISFIDKIINTKYFDKEKIIGYLNMHSLVGNEIFSYCDKRAGRDGATSYTTWLDDDLGYTPLSVDVFVRRIPFYFYKNEVSNHYSGSLHDVITGTYRENKSLIKLELIYLALEYMYYEKNLPLEEIFNYITDQTGHVGNADMFLQWKHYLELCDLVGKRDYLPDCFIYSYNEMLENAGLSPVIYEIDDPGLGEAYIRNGTKIEFEGLFPYDSNGQPVMKWIGLRLKNAKNITCSQRKSHRGRLYIEITSNTTVYALNFYNDKGNEDWWYQIYAGPLTMEFDHEILKDSRERLKFTQKEVADAVGATVRTYQKWEYGETTPDGHYLLRLLNWLDIRDIQNVVRYIE